MSTVPSTGPLPTTNLLQGKTVVVTGSSRGIGRACAIQSARNGADVVLHIFGDELSRKEAKEIAKEIAELGRKSVEVEGDISLPETSTKIVAAALTLSDRIDVLISNAGICPFAPFLTMPLATYKITQAVNMDGTFYITQAVANQMATQSPPGGSIIAISSISALVGGGNQTHYTPTKAGIKSLMESCAIALGPHGIRCNSVLPGTIATAINVDDLADPVKEKAMSARTCVGRLGVRAYSLSSFLPLEIPL
ncbi:short-chain dehydrogenase/reductase sdr [Mrakia frigida]|uniref:SDR family NAD(P)-dependent oxidoreductase n=1 Tax=Mrakia frigida TaxID=29902 RepID=UPI003FCBF2DA